MFFFNHKIGFTKVFGYRCSNYEKVFQIEENIEVVDSGMSGDPKHFSERYFSY